MNKRITFIFLILVLLFSMGCGKDPVPFEKPVEWKSTPASYVGPTELTTYDVVPAGEGLWALKMFGFDGDDELSRFVYGDVNVYIERASDQANPDDHYAEATFFRSNVTEGKRLYFYVLTHPLRGIYSDWSAGDKFSFAVNNVNDFDVMLHFEISDANGNTLEQSFNLESWREHRISIPVSTLSAGSLDASEIKSITIWLIDSEMPDIATLHFDDFILTGSDQEALQTMKNTADAESERLLAEYESQERAGYLPTINNDPQEIENITSKFNPGPIQGVANCDVVVVGGGMSGCSAAIAASRAGADVILVEAYGFLGGMATAGMVFPFMNSRAGNEQIVEGIFLEIFEHMAKDGLAKRDKHDPGVIWFDKEALKYTLQELCVGSGVKLLLHSWAEGPLQVNPPDGTTGPVEGIVVGNKSGRTAILAKVTIDCTGDGDIAAAAGCPYEQGRGYDPYGQSVTLFFRMGNVSINKAFAEQGKRLSRSKDMIPANYMFADKFREAKEKGDLDPDLPIKVVYFEKTLSPGVVSINATRVFKVDPTDATDLTWAVVETRRQVHQLSRFLVKYIPGFENAFLSESAIHIGVRESRRILGEYQLTGRDVLSAKKFDDVIARGAFGIDIHCADYSGCGVVGLDLEEGRSYDIPYGVLVPLEVDGIMVAGRCISATHVALGSVRIMPVASATGQAAGAAAALCVEYHTQPRDLDVTRLQELLIEQDVNLGK